MPCSQPSPSIPWDKIYFFWGDERHVPPDDAESNYRMANEALLSKVPVPPGNVFRIHSEEKDASIAASQYEQTLQQFFHLAPGDFPRFDLIYLGLGPDGHAASLFPDSAALNERRRLVVANWVEKFKTDRITFTFPVLNAAACVVFLASGPDKAAIVHQVLENPQRQSAIATDTTREWETALAAGQRGRERLIAVEQDLNFRTRSISNLNIRAL